MKDEEVVNLLNNRFDAVERRFDGIEAKIEASRHLRCDDVIKLKTIQVEQEKANKRVHAILALALTVFSALAAIISRMTK